jgi:hypothetical protein
VEIDSPDITMEGVNQPLLGISDEGDVQYMEPGKDYKFKGKKVKEYSVAQDGDEISSTDEVTYTHEPGQRGAYRLQRTVTPYTSNRDIRKYTQTPTAPRQVNFLQNYAGAIGGYQDDPGFNYPTQVPYEGAKHWNVDRFIIDPQFSGRNITNKESLEQNRANVLADMYKYYMLQDPEHRGKAFRKAKRFVHREIDPKIEGPFLQSYNTVGTENPDRFQIGNQGPENFANENKLKDLYWSQMTGNDNKQVTPEEIDKLKNVSMDYFRNYKKMSKKEAKDQWKNWEEDAANFQKTGNYENGGSMTYYQHGLDWKPKSMEEGGWLDKYEVPKNQNAKFVLPRFDMPRAASESTSAGISKKDVELLDELAKRKQFEKYVTNQPQFKQASKSTPAQEKERIKKNKEYAAKLPNAQIDEEGNVSRVNPNRSVTGEAENFMSRREDKAGEHALGALEAAGYVTGAGELVGAGYNALKTALGESMESGLLSKVNTYGNDLIQTSKAAGKFKLPTYQNAYRWQADVVPQQLREVGLTLTPEQQSLTGSWYTKEPNQLGFYIRTRPGAGNINTARLSENQIANLEANMSGAAKGMSGKSSSITTSDTYKSGELILPENLRAKTQSIRFDVNPTEYINPYGGSIEGSLYDKAFLEHQANEIVQPILEAQQQPILGIPRKYFPFKKGGVIKDDRGQWAHPGEITEIGSNRITMQGVDYPVLGISDKGDTQMMLPGEEYKFKGKKVTEFPMAQNGLGGTRADSIMIRNNSIAKDSFYKNNPSYYKGKSTGVNFKDSNTLRNIANDVIKTRKAFHLSDALYLTKPSPNTYGITYGNLKDKLGKVPNSNIYIAPDVISANGVDTYFNPEAPPVFFSPDILPQGTRTYYNDTKGDVSESPYYDPLAITPWDMLNPPQQKERLKRFGTSGTPYANSKNNPPSKSTTTKQTTQKPKPKPSLQRRVSDVQLIDMEHDVNVPGITTLQHPPTSSRPLPEGNYMLGYHDENNQGIDRGFITPEQRTDFIKDLQSRNLSGVQPYMGNITEYYKTPSKKKNGGWLDKYK